MSRRLTQRTGSTSSTGSSTGSSGSCPNSPLQLKGQYRIVVMGAPRVGKTSVISRFLYEKFTSSYKATVDELHRAEYEINGMPLNLDVQDTCGSHEFPAMRELSISNGDAFILVYDVTDEASFEEVSRLRDQILDTKNEEGVPIVVVGNKSDLQDSRVLTREHVESTACIDWDNGYVECSAKDNENILEVFKELLVQAKIPLALEPSVKSRKGSTPTSPKRKNKTANQAGCTIS